MAGVVVRMGARLCIVVDLIGWLFLCVCVCVVVDAFELGAYAVGLVI